MHSVVKVGASPAFFSGQLEFPDRYAEKWCACMVPLVVPYFHRIYIPLVYV